MTTRINAPLYLTGFGNHFASEAAPGVLPYYILMVQKNSLFLNFNC